MDKDRLLKQWEAALSEYDAQVEAAAFRAVGEALAVRGPHNEQVAIVVLDMKELNALRAGKKPEGWGKEG